MLRNVAPVDNTSSVDNAAACNTSWRLSSVMYCARGVSPYVFPYLLHTAMKLRHLGKVNYSKPSLIRLVNPDRNMKISVHSWVHTLKFRHMGLWSKRTFRLCWRQLERLKPRKNISNMGFSWMEEYLDFSSCYSDIFLFSSAVLILLNFPFICFLSSFVFKGYLFARLIRITEGLL
jgi:hypothetical protein